MKSNPLRTTAVDEKLPSYGVVVLESHHSPQFTMEWRRHEFIKIVYVLRGSGRFEFDESKLSFSTSDVVVVPPRTRNRIIDDRDSAASLYVCCIDVTLLSFDATIASRLKRAKLDSDPSAANRIASLMRRMRHDQTRTGADVPLMMVAHALRLMTWIVGQNASRTPPSKRKEPADHQAVRAYVERLETDFFEARSIDDAAQELGMSRRSFTSRFHTITGQTWLQHVRALAVAHAQKLLQDTDLPVTAVAFESGFNDLSTFYRQFKSQTGQSPKKYRNQFSVE